MGRPSKLLANLGLPPVRPYWQQIEQEERTAEVEERAKRKGRDKKRAKCRCDAYPWPHRPGGGFCRYPEPPIQRWQRPEANWRPYRKRYLGILRQIARASGLHPIRDRAQIQQLMPFKL